MGAAVFGSHDLTFDATLSESRADDDTVLSREFLSDIVGSDILRIDEGDDRLMVVVGTGL